MGTFETPLPANIILHSAGEDGEHLFGIPVARVKQSISDTLKFARKGFPGTTPLVGIVPPHQTSPVFAVRFITELEDSSSFLHLSDIITSWFPLGTALCPSAMHCVPFSMEENPERRFFFWEMSASFVGKESHKFFQEHIGALQQEILLVLKRPQCAPQLIATRESSKGSNSMLLRRELIQYILQGKPHTPPETLNELSHFLLSSDQEFKALRTPQHLLRLVRTHYCLRKRHTRCAPCPPGEKRVLFRLFPSFLQFPFGQRQVLSVAISIDALQPHEQFDDRHILLACKRCLGSVEIVPRSFYTYHYPEETTVTFYVEIEKADGLRFSLSEIVLLRRELGEKLIRSIEQMASRIDIPQNEEDIIRSILLLSQQLRSAKDIPQVMVQFRGQSEQTLEFQVLLMRLLKDNHEGQLHFPRFPDIVRLTPLRSSIVGKLRNKYPKQALVFLARCSKAPFLRHDRSVDFLRAREFVVQCIESTIGKVRDLNGGLFLQQHQLLEGIRPLLSDHETNEIFLIEELFHSVIPSIMKSILGPEHILTMFRQAITMRASMHQGNPQHFLVEEYMHAIFIGFVCPESLSIEEIMQARARFHLSENDLALCHCSSQGFLFGFVVCLDSDSETRKALVDWIRHIVEERKRNAISPRSLRISFPRPTVSLDPRIDADTTSGAVLKLLYEGLMRLDVQGQPSFAIAEHVDISQDRTCYTFTLRPTYWSNGQPLTAHDFEYSWKKVVDPSFPTLFDYLFAPIKNARKVKSGHLRKDELGVKATSTKTLVVELEKPAPFFLELCCHWMYSPLCCGVDERHPGWAHFGTKHYLCNGPFALSKWNPKKGLQLFKNSWYWDKDHVFLDRIDISIVENSLQALRLFEQGQLDWIGEPLCDTPLELVRNKDPRVLSRKIPAVQWFALNVQEAPFQSKKVRQALSYALDRKAIISHCLGGDERPSHSILPQSVSLLEGGEGLPYNPSLARALLHEGLAEQHLHISTLPSLRLLSIDREPQRTIVERVVRFWRENLGLSIQVEFSHQRLFIEKVSERSHHITATVWYSWFHDPLYTFETLRNPNFRINASRWGNETFTELVEKAEHMPAQRKEFLEQAEMFVMEEMPIIPVFDYTARYLKNNSLENVCIARLGNIDFRWAHPLRR
jgi:oligopeptide transport system substrate-binding protein